MAASHNGTAIIAAGTSNAVGATTTSSVVNLTAAYSASIAGVLTNGATGPTTPASVIIETSIDGTSNWREVYRLTSDTLANTVLPWSYVYQDYLYTRVRVTGNTGQPVTTDAFAHVTIGI